MMRLTALITLTLTAGGAAACDRTAPPPDAAARDPIVVAAAPATVFETYERLEAGGVVEAEDTATVSSRIIADVATVRVMAGDRVRSGDVLVTLDARDAMERTHQARASARSAETAVIQARSNHDAAEAERRLAAAWQRRIAALHARDSATSQELDEAAARLSAADARLAGSQAAIDGADAQLAAARAALAAATATESFATLRAPFDALVTERLTDPGNLATPGMPLVRLESSGVRQVVVRLDEARAAHVNPGDRVPVSIGTADGTRTNDGGLEGVVSEMSRVVGVDQRAVAVTLTLPGTVAARSGSFARVVFRGAPRRALLVPATAVQRRGQVATLFVVEQGIARMRPVHAGPTTPQGVEVLAGVAAGESIVVSPPPQLADGVRVTVEARASPAGPR